MNYTKIQQDILKLRLEELQKHKPVKITYQQINNNVWISSDGFVIYAIPIRFFILDVENFERPPVVSIKPLLDTTGYKECYPTNQKRIMEKCTAVVLKLDTGDVHDTEVFIDERLLKNFDKSATFRSKSQLSPVHVYENGELVGVVCPLRP
jgi:hypothetical protein